jgi:hypothetical protein
LVMVGMVGMVVEAVSDDERIAVVWPSIGWRGVAFSLLYAHARLAKPVRPCTVCNLSSRLLAYSEKWAGQSRAESRAEGQRGERADNDDAVITLSRSRLRAISLYLRCLPGPDRTRYKARIFPTGTGLRD